MASAFSWQNSISLCPASFHIPRSNLPVTPGISQKRQWHPTPVLLPGKSHGQRNLEGCSPWGRWGSDKTERLPFHFSLSCIGEGNGNPLQCSCLENPRDEGAWWAAVYGVAQSRTRLKQLSKIWEGEERGVQFRWSTLLWLNGWETIQRRLCVKTLKFMFSMSVKKTVLEGSFQPSSFQPRAK